MIRMSSSRLTVLLAWVGAMVAGCGMSEPKAPPLAVDQLVARYNADVAPIETLFAKARIQVWSSPYNWGSMLGSPNGTLMLGKGKNVLGPGNFVLIGRESGVPIFNLGTNINENVYYFWGNYGDKGKAWLGSLDLAGAAGVKDIPIDPTQLISVLCVNELPWDLTKLPAVALTMHRPAKGIFGPAAGDDYAYVLTYIDRQPVSNRILFKREVYFRWSDSQPCRPFKVNLIDGSGNRVMTAMLKDYQPIKMPEGYTGPVPVMPTDIDIAWPAKGSRIHIALSLMTVGRGDPDAASSFAANKPSSISDIEYVDEDLLQSLESLQQVQPVPSSQPTQPTSAAGASE
jgi:hypothetical protein